MEGPVPEMAALEVAEPDGMKLQAFAAPPNADHDLASMAQSYAWRDAELHPDKLLTAWRQEIDALLAGGAPYGKGFAPDACPAEAFIAWRNRLEGTPKNLSPVQVYAAAPDMALAWLGY